MKLITILSSALNNRTVEVKRKSTSESTCIHRCQVQIDSDKSGYDIILTDLDDPKIRWFLDPDLDFITRY